MNYFSFIEIATLKNEASLFENIRNNLVNFKKTLNSKFARCASVLQKSFLYLSMSIEFTFLLTLPTVFFKILLPKKKQLFQNYKKFC